MAVISDSSDGVLRRLAGVTPAMSNNPSKISPQHLVLISAKWTLSSCHCLKLYLSAPRWGRASRRHISHLTSYDNIHKLYLFARTPTEYFATTVMSWLIVTSVNEPATESTVTHYTEILLWAQTPTTRNTRHDDWVKIVPLGHCIFTIRNSFFDIAVHVSTSIPYLISISTYTNVKKCRRPFC